MGAIYFLAGVLSTLLGLILWDPEGRRQRLKPQRWERIDRLDWRWRFPFTFITPISPNALGAVVSHMMEEQLKLTPIQGVEVQPGSYTVSLSVDATFIKREES